MKGYKGFDKDLKCRDMQYEVGKTYEEDEAKLCKKGLHFCEAPLDVFGYYAPVDSRYCEVEADGVTDDKDNDSKRVAKKLTIGAEIGIPGLIKAHINWVNEHIDEEKKQSNTGDCSAASNTGYYSAASNTGDYSAASNTGYCSAASNTGYCSAASNTGDCSAASNTGDCSAASNTGNYSAASVSGKGSVALNIGYMGKAKGALGCYIVLAEWKDGEISAVKSHKVDGKKIKPDTWYRLVDGKFTEVTDDDEE